MIVSAISTQDWSGEAAVDVSIVNWGKELTAAHCVLDGVAVSGITPALRPAGADTSTAGRISKNIGRAFQGPQPVGAGFVLDPEEARELLTRTDASYSDVVRPYLIGEDILERPDQAPSRYIIDFASRRLEEAMAYPAALRIVRDRVKPFRDQNRRKTRRERWWLLGELVPAMRKALGPLPRYLATSAVAKRFEFVWCDPSWCPSNRTIVVALETEFAIGVLTSSAHRSWAIIQGGTFEDRPHYTHRSAFETFPFPQPSDKEPVAEAARRVIARRSEICLERQIGLTKLYNEVDEGAYRDLKELHVALDEAVAAAYGWPASVAHDPQESNRLLLELNREIAAGRVAYDPF